MSDAQPGVVVLSDGEIRAQTLVWAAGTAPNPLVKTLPFEKDKRGGVKVDSALAVPGYSRERRQSVSVPLAISLS